MMKKFFKTKFFYFILGAIIFGSIGTVLAYTIIANNVGFEPKDASWRVDNTSDALNDLKSFASLKGHGATSYSITEKVVGTWIDGKPLYQTTLVTTSSFNLSHGGDWASIPGWSSVISNAKEITYVYAHHNYSQRIDWVSNNANNGKYVTFYSLDSYFTIPAGTACTIQYTKTTD